MAITLRRKIVFAFLVFPLIVFIAGGVLAYEEIVGGSANAREEAMRTAGIIAGVLRHRLEVEHQDSLAGIRGLQGFVEDMNRDNNYRLILVAPDTKILADVDRRNVGSIYSLSGRDKLIRVLKDGVARIFNDRVGGSGGRKLQTAFPIMTDDHKLAGALLLDCTGIYRAEREVIMRENATITITAFITIICSILFGSSLSRRTTRQIRRLEKGVSEIAQGNLDYVIPSNGEDELSILSESFNQMATDLRMSRLKSEDQMREIKESEARFRLATRASHDIIWEWDAIAREIAYSGGAGRIFGCADDEVVLTYDFWRERVHPEDLEHVTSLYRSAIRNRQESWSTSYRIRRRDGSFLHVLDRVCALYDEKGDLVRLVGAASDITERMRAEQSLAERESSFRLLFANNPHPMWVYDLETYKILEVNDSATDSYGYSRDEFLRMTILDLRPPEEVPRLLADLARKRHPLQHSGEWMHLRKDGNIFYVDINSHVLDFKGHKAALVIAQDVTRRKEAEKSLRASEIRFRSLVERSSDVTSIIDQNGKVLYMSPSVSRMGYTTEDIKGKTAFDFVHPEDVNRTIDTIKLALEEPDVPHAVELRFKDKDGTWHDSESIVFNQLNVPEVRGLVVNSRDITERKKLEAQFLRAQRMESVGILAGGIAHDLNNVLAPIMLSVDLLRDAETNPKTQSVINTIETSVNRGSALIRQVLSFARGMEGEHVIVQLRHLIVEIEKIVRETFPRSIEMLTNVPRNLWTVMGDATQLHQIMMNLCVNSRDAMPKGGRILIAAENVLMDEESTVRRPLAKVGPYIALTVADTGVGIPKSDIDKIFNPFFTTKEIGKGTGLGLSTVSTIVKNHGGFIEVESEIEKGTIFRVYLPAQTVSQPVQEEIVSREKYAGSGELVLIVDDETAVREFMKVTLETYGYKTIVSSDGTEAMKAFASSQEKVDLVITDVMMPYMDGPATITGLKKLDPSVKIIAVSGLTEKEIGVEVNEVEALLNKPFAAGLLLKTVEEVLKRTTSSVPSRTR